MLATCARAKDVDKAEAWMKRLLAESPRIEADSWSFCAVADACAQAGDLKRAESWIARMEGLGFRATASTYGILMHASAKSGDGDQVDKLFQKWRRPDLNRIRRFLTLSYPYVLV